MNGRSPTLPDWHAGTREGEAAIGNRESPWPSGNYLARRTPRPVAPLTALHEIERFAVRPERRPPDCVECTCAPPFAPRTSHRGTPPRPGDPMVTKLLQQSPAERAQESERQEDGLL